MSSDDRHARHGSLYSMTGRWFAVIALWVSMGGVLSTSGCTAVQTMPDREERAFLILEVEPSSTEIYIDSEYRGVVEGWTGNAVPILPGEHRVALHADGHITRRFDVEADAGEQVVLRVVMEPTLD
ncbi:MAG: hypothetical protein ACQEVA_09485 [Myxococcota bacterium]